MHTKLSRIGYALLTIGALLVTTFQLSAPNAGAAGNGGTIVIWNYLATTGTTPSEAPTFTYNIEKSSVVLDPLSIVQGSSGEAADLSPGMYSVVQTVTSGWTPELSEPTKCTNADGEEYPPDEIVLSPREVVTCSFYNTNATPGKITVVKNAPAGTTADFSVTLTSSTDPKGTVKSFSLASAAEFEDLTIGTYKVEESPAPGWTQTAVSCVNGSDENKNPDEIELGNGEEVTCTFTNAPTLGAIALDKITRWVDPFPVRGDGVVEGDEITIVPAANAEVTWQYVVANVGEVDLTKVVLTDDLEGIISCPQLLLEVDELMTCTATGTAAIPDAGQNVTYANNAKVEAVASDGGFVSDSDASSYVGVEAPIPSVLIVSQTRWVDPESGTVEGDNIMVDPAANPVITWVFTVSNPTRYELKDLVVVDSEQGAVECPSDTLAARSEMTCMVVGTAKYGTYANEATVTGVAPGGAPVTSSDGSGYTTTTAMAVINVEVVANTAAGTATKQTFRFVGPAGEFVLAAGGTESFSVAPGRYSFAETVPDGWVLSSVSCSEDSDPASISVKANDRVTCTFNFDEVRDVAVALDKVTRWVDPIDGPVVGDGITVLPGANASVSWVYTVTNSGNTSLADVSLIDTVEGAVTCPKAALAAGESMICSIDGTAVTPTGGATEVAYANTATVTASGTDGTAVSDVDKSSYTSSVALETVAISLDKATVWVDPDNGPITGDGITIQPSLNPSVSWLYTITNTGTASLANIALSDDVEGDVRCPTTSLVAGQSMVCTLDGTAIIPADGAAEATYVNNATVTATASDGTTARATDISSYASVEGLDPEGAVSIDTRTRGVEPGTGQTVTGDNVELVPGEPMAWIYLVTNTGSIPIEQVRVIDDVAGEALCPKTSLAVGESVDCTLEGVASVTMMNGQVTPYTNVGTVTAQTMAADNSRAATRAMVTDNDWSRYVAFDYGHTPGPSLQLEKVTNGDDGLTIAAGSPVTWTYTVTNDGGENLTGVAIVDDREGAVPCVATTLKPGESMVCTLQSTAVNGDYLNVATATAIGSDGTSVSAVDASNYHGAATTTEVVPQPTTSQGEPGATAEPAATATPGDPVASKTPGGKTGGGGTITAGGGDGGGLAVTGASSKVTMVVGLLLMAAGLGLVLLGRRQRGVVSSV